MTTSLLLATLRLSIEKTSSKESETTIFYKDSLREHVMLTIEACIYPLLYLLECQTMYITTVNNV